ncbi:hypothetical protein ACWD4G_18025 [Streptomyces sp. NPDC002643]
MNSERPDNPETPDEGPEPDATEQLGSAGDDVTGAEGTDEAEATTASVTESDAGEGDGDGDGEAADVPPADVVHVGGGEPRPRRSRVAVAAVAAAVLLVGGGGAYLATSGFDGNGDSGGSAAPGGDGTPPPLALDGYASGGSNGIAPGEPDPHGVTYRADGELPDGPESAPVYAVEGEVTAAEVARLAKALGVEGTPTASGEFWRVGGAKDGSGALLQVGAQAPGSWSFNRYAPGTDNCQKVDVCSSGGTAEGADPVSEAVARKAAAPVLKAVGQDDAKVDASGLLGSVRVVNADPEVGGLPTYGWATGVQIGADGRVTAGNGNLKTPVKSDTYPVVDADRALDLLNGSGQGVGTAREGVDDCATPVPMDGGDGDIKADEPVCGASTLPEPEPVAVEDAVFGLASHHVDGQPALVPSWMFEVRPAGAEESYTVSYPAVDPKYLASPETRTEPTEPPSDLPGTTSPDAQDVEIQGYTVDGDELTVSFWGGVCSDYSASVSEESGEVTVTVTGTPWEGKVCIMIAKAMERTVQLDQPLGDREVVGSDGKEIPEGGIAELQPQ